jgi:hypothetical protein
MNYSLKIQYFSKAQLKLTMPLGAKGSEPGATGGMGSEFFRFPVIRW